MRDALWTPRTCRYAIGGILTGKTVRTAADAAAVATLVARGTLTTLDGAAFGLLDSPVADDSVSIGAGAAVLTSPNNPWLAGDVGKVIDVQGAGVAGATLRSRIKAFTNAGSVTLWDNASTAVAATSTSAVGLAIWGNDLTEARNLPVRTTEDGATESSKASTFVVPTGVPAARSLADRLAEVFYTADFKAVGDGVADDTAAVQACLTAAGVLGKSVVLSGVHKITAPLVFNNAAATPGLSLSAPSRAGYGFLQAFTGVGLTLFGRDITVSNVYFSNDAAHLAGSTALEIAGQRMVAERLLFDAPDTALFLFHPTNVVVRDSEIRCAPTTTKGIYAFQANGDAQHPNQVVIDNCVIVDYAGGNTATTGVLMRNIDTLHVRRTNCQSLNVGVQVDSAGGGAYTANLIHIGPNNNLEDCVTPVSLANVTNAWVFGNEVTPSNRGANAIIANTVGPLIIAGNLLVNSQHENVLCTNCNAVTFTGNTTGDASRAATGTYATLKLDTCIKSVVTGNTLIGRSSVAIDPLTNVLLLNCTGAMVAGNYYDEQLGPFARVQTSGTKVNVFTDHKSAEGDLWWGRYLKDQSGANPLWDTQGNGNTLAGLLGNLAGDSDVALINANADGVHGGGISLYQQLTANTRRLLAFFRGTASAILYAPAAANKSADGALGNSYLTFYLDEVGNTLTFRVKYSNGTLKTGTVALV